MLNFDKKKGFTLFALTLLVTSMLLVGINLPSALPTDDLIYLDGPSLTPIHMHGPSLTPIHMHSLLGIIDLSDPWYTPWHELYPVFCEEWEFTSWEDNGNEYLDSSDQIDMYNIRTEETRWFHVDRVTMTLHLWSDDYQEEIYVEYKGDYDPYIFPICTLWHEVWPVYNGVTGGPYHIIDWIDNGSGFLDFCDYIMFEDWPGIWWHVEEYATDLILNEKVMDPIGIEWHELYPNYCDWHLLTSWEEPIEDAFPGRLSPGDQIDMFNYRTEETKWYYVDRVTLTLSVTIIGYPEDFYYFEYKGSFEDMYNVKTEPVCTYWHMVWPEYWDGCFHLEDWVDNCNGVLDYCDEILLEGEWCHVEGLAIDIILNEKIDDPTGIIWHELYPDCCVNDYETLDWEDNGDGLLNPCDNVTLALFPTGLTEKYHVENMTLTLNLTIEDIAGTPPFTVGERIYIEYLDAIYFGWEWLYYPKTNPNYTDWEVVCPNDQFGYSLSIENWYDNCNGVLSYCDELELSSPDGALWVHVDEVALDITVKKITEEPPPPQWYKKPPYPDYAPSGMPDFDQKQDGWFHPMVGWTWCGPVACANSMWWFDSQYDPSNIVTAYGPWDDHNVQNVDPLVHDLAWHMDTDGIRTGIIHTGTLWWDMFTGLQTYLVQQGVDDILEVHAMELPDFYWIEEEIYRCQDVVLLLEFWDDQTHEKWIYDPGGEGGHYVTCAGVNSTTLELLIADPWHDAAEAGWVPGDIPVPHPYPHGVDIHNDTQYVSHDAYTAAFNTAWGAWELLGYLQTPGYGFAPTWHAFITAAVVTSPIGVHDVAVTDVTPHKYIVGCTYNCFIYVNVTNEGTFDETFSVTAYADAIAIQTQSTFLASGDSTTLTFTWNANSTFTKGNYTVSAYAWPVLGEVDTGDNNYINGIVTVVVPGDLNGDGIVDVFDAVLLAGHVGHNYPWLHPYIDPICDINSDWNIDVFDAVILAGHAGQTWRPGDPNP